MSRNGWMKLAVVTAATAMLLVGCGAAGSQQAMMLGAPAEAPALSAAEQALAPAGPTLGGQRQGDVLAWLSSDPSQPVRGEARMDAYLVGIDGKPITDAKVTFDTDMTNMSHGLYLVQTQATGDGHYVGPVHFSMPGPWRVIAVVERPGQETARLRFKFTVNR